MPSILHDRVYNMPQEVLSRSRVIKKCIIQQLRCCGTVYFARQHACPGIDINCIDFSCRTAATAVSSQRMYSSGPSPQ